jgi:hypothetical protein
MSCSGVSAGAERVFVGQDDEGVCEDLEPR